MIFKKSGRLEILGSTLSQKLCTYRQGYQLLCQWRLSMRLTNSLKHEIPKQPTIEDRTLKFQMRKGVKLEVMLLSMESLLLSGISEETKNMQI